MSAAPAPAIPAPLARLLSVLTVDQAEQLAKAIERVRLAGHGVVALDVAGGEVVFLRVEESVDIRRQARRPRPV